MFREMRLKDNQLTKEEAVEMLHNSSHGTLALSGDGGYTYAVPVNFAYDDGKIYFHGATEGHKLDSIKKNNKISFCVIEKDEILSSEFNSLYRSAIAFGTARVITGDMEKQRALELILQKYSGDFMESGRKYAKGLWDKITVVEIIIDHLTGKKGT